MRANLLFIFIACSTACTPNSSPFGPGGLPETGRPALHAVQNERLHDLMDEINSLMFERMRTQLDIDRERRRRAGEIAEVARAMSERAGEMLSTLPELKLSPEEQTTFAALAKKLRAQSMQLEEEASSNYIDAIPQSIERMSLTCTACHELFRDNGR